jgi:hypothetical protein
MQALKVHVVRKVQQVLHLQLGRKAIPDLKVIQVRALPVHKDRKAVKELQDLQDLKELQGLLDQQAQPAALAPRVLPGLLDQQVHPRRDRQVQLDLQALPALRDLRGPLDLPEVPDLEVHPDPLVQPVQSVLPDQLALTAHQVQLDLQAFKAHQVLQVLVKDLLVELARKALLVHAVLLDQLGLRSVSAMQD